jgi:hypothetical protein
MPVIVATAHFSHTVAKFRPSAETSDRLDRSAKIFAFAAWSHEGAATLFENAADSRERVSIVRFAGVTAGRP